MKSVSVTICTPYGPVKIVTFKEFVKLIPIKEWHADTDCAGYYRRKTVPGNSYETGSSYITAFKYISKTPITATELVDGLIIEDRLKYYLTEMVYDMATQSALEMGNPTHVVRLGRRFWMVANPEDFLIFFNHNGTAVANLRPSKSVVWLVK